MNNVHVDKEPGVLKTTFSIIEHHKTVVPQSSPPLVRQPCTLWCKNEFVYTVV